MISKMKNMLLRVGALASALFMCASCEKEETMIGIDELPGGSVAFLSEHFGGVTIGNIKKERNSKGTDYTTYLDNGVKVKFDGNGDWKEVEAPRGRTVPTSFIPQQIVDYVAENHQNLGVNCIEKEKYGFEVELTNGLDLEFDVNGVFVRTDGSCEEKESPSIGIAEFPRRSMAFLSDHFGEAKPVHLKKKKEGRKGSEYTTYLDNGVKVKFDGSGDWKEVEAPRGGAIPTSFIPQKIVDYVTANCAGQQINSIEKERFGFEVKLTGRLELEFSANGDFLRIDR